MVEKNTNSIIKRIDELNAFANSMSAKDALAANKAAEEALELSKEIDYLKGKIYATFYIGESLFRQGNIYDAIKYLRNSLNLNMEPVDKLAQSMTYTTLGNVHLYMKLYDLSFYYFRMALNSIELLERYESQAMIHNNIGEIYRELGDYDKALDSYGQCLDISEKNGFVRVGMFATANIGVTDYETKNYQAAIYYLEKSLVTAKELNNQIIEGFASRYLGLIYFSLKDYDNSLKHLLAAMDVYKNSNETISSARIYKDLAQLEYQFNRSSKALELLEKAQTIAEALQDKRLIVAIYDLFSKIYSDLGEFEHACKYYALGTKLKNDQETQNNEHRLKSIDFQLRTWNALEESEMYQKMNKDLQEKTERLEKVTKELQKINKEVKALSDMDGLTRIANRIRLDDYAQEAFTRGYKNKANLTMMIIDIDNFKEYNDFYGHLIGDEALKKLARILEKSIEGKDALVARFGGDEFVLIAYDCDIEEAKKIAKSINKNLQSRKIKHEKSYVSQYLTISIGIISQIPQRKSTYALMMDFADQALYQAKEKGKNQTEVYENIH